MVNDTDQQHASQQEVRVAIENLGPTDYAKLILIARSFARTRLQGTAMEPTDLLHNAVVKTLDGRRRWNKKVSILKHLDRVMESDSGHLAAQHVTHATDPIDDCPVVPACQGVLPVTRISAIEQINDVLALFAEDKMARDLLVLKSEGFLASEIQKELGIDKTQYETITKRIRRRCIHCLAGGRKHETK